MADDILHPSIEPPSTPIVSTSIVEEDDCIVVNAPPVTPLPLPTSTPKPKAVSRLTHLRDAAIKHKMASLPLRNSITGSPSLKPSPSRSRSITFLVTLELGTVVKQQAQARDDTDKVLIANIYYENRKGFEIKGNMMKNWQLITDIFNVSIGGKFKNL
jgi:hypothetical protein